MHATKSLRSLPRTIRSGFRSLVRSRTSTGERRVKQDEEFRILESTSEDVSACSSPATVNISPLTTLSLNPGTSPSTPYLLLRDSPLASLELALLCTAQCISLEPQESQAAVLLAVTATRATVVQIGEPVAAEAQVAIIDIDADAHSPSISVTLPTAIKKTTPETDLKSVPLQDITSLSTLRPYGRKRVSRRQSLADEENLAPAPKEEYTTRACPSRPLRRRDAFNRSMREGSFWHTTLQRF